MSKSRSNACDFGVYLLVRLIVAFIQTLSVESARSVASGLAWLAYKVDRRHRLVALDNLRHAFPDCYNNEQLHDLVRAVYRHFCLLVVELMQLPRKMHYNNWRQYMDLTNARPVVDGLLSPEPLLIVTGHFGNWELAGYALGLLGFRTYAVARPLDNAYLDDFLRRFRESTGQRLLAKKGDFDHMQALLDRGGAMATLGDQDAGQRGLFVDYFGRPASTHKAMALLCLEHRVPIVVVGTPRVAEPMRHQVVAADAIRPEEYAGRSDAIKAITQRLTSALESIVRRYPAQYFWLHRRWKHQPKARKTKQAA